MRRRRNHAPLCFNLVGTPNSDSDRAYPGCIYPVVAESSCGIYPSIEIGPHTELFARVPPGMVAGRLAWYARFESIRCIFNRSNLGGAWRTRSLRNVTSHSWERMVKEPAGPIRRARQSGKFGLKSCSTSSREMHRHVLTSLTSGAAPATCFALSEEPARSRTSGITGSTSPQWLLIWPAPNFLTERSARWM